MKIGNLEAENPGVAYILTFPTSFSPTILLKADLIPIVVTSANILKKLARYKSL